MIGGDTVMAADAVVATVNRGRYSDRGWTRPEGDANARLIAAAPELLAACEGTLAMAEAFYRTLPDDGAEQDHYMTTVIEPARLALSRARGGGAA